MNIYELIAYNIKFYIKKLENNLQFKKEHSNESYVEYISKLSGIKVRRLNNILSTKGYIRIDELGRIADELGIPIEKLVDDTLQDI